MSGEKIFKNFQSAPKRVIIEGFADGGFAAVRQVKESEARK
jgi:hypothetical protein